MLSIFSWKLGKFVLVILTTLLSGGVAFADIEEAKSAYARGDFRAAFGEFLRLAHQGDVEAQHSLGVLFRDGVAVPRNYQEAFRWHYMAANSGHAGSQAALARMHALGWGVQQSANEANRWWIRAAESGDPEAMYQFGAMHEAGLAGKSPDMVAALKWYLAAVELSAGRLPTFRINLLKGQLAPEEWARAEVMAQALVDKYRMKHAQ